MSYLISAATPDAMIPKVAAMDDLLSTLDLLSASGDLETQNAIALMRPGAQDLRDVLASGKTGLPYLDAEDAYVAGISQLATRCQSAGSSAFS